ncbi:MAG: hypothetical protein L3K26_16450, partial [Candidatus Hydrogenedentes bacterium]|nr:hypothetical protein [Candidatus Hydrogenedentota bacterium]
MPDKRSPQHHGSPSRRTFLASTMAGTAGILSQPLLSAEASVQSVDSAAPITIGSRRELFVDHALIEELTGGARQQLHHPVPREAAVEHDAPWEGNACGYHNVFQDGDLYRMYYNARHITVLDDGNINLSRHPVFCCYAESKDGIHWEKPELGLREFQGSKKNNIIFENGVMGAFTLVAGHISVFKDENPDTPADARYKAIGWSHKPNGLVPFKSADGLHWTPMTEVPMLQDQGAFDTQNLAFWDTTIGKYRAYWRIFTGGSKPGLYWSPGAVRAIRTATSDDLIHWGPTTDLTYEDSPEEELYTNQIKPYPRAPHLLIGFPTRYIERGWSPSMRALPEAEGRVKRSQKVERYGTALSEGLLMVSRDGRHFTRWNEAFLRPGIERPGTWHYGHQFIAWHTVETQSALPGAPNELSIYAPEGLWHEHGDTLRRYTLRLDGFVSVNAPLSGG